MGIGTRLASIVTAMLALSACGGGGGDDNAPPAGNPPPPSTFTVGGSVVGLADGTSLVLQNNGGGDLSLGAQGAFTFSAALASGSAYHVKVTTQPAAQVCTVSRGVGTVSTANVTNVAVLCTPRIGKFLYVTNLLSDNVSAYSINAADGSLSAVAGSPFAADVAPQLATAAATGNRLYVINRGSDSAPPRASVYSINHTTGVLTQNSMSPFDVANPPPPPNGGLGNAGVDYYKPLVHRSGQFIYVSSIAGTIYGLSADANGSLSPVHSTVAGNAMVPGEADKTGKFLYFAHNYFNAANAGGVAAYQIDSGSGALQSLGQFSTGAVGPNSSVLTPSGRFLLVAQSIGGSSSTPGSSSVAVFAVDSLSGTLTAVAGSPFNAANYAEFITTHPAKNFVYTLGRTASDARDVIAGYQIDATTGVLTPIAGSPFPTGGFGTHLLIDPLGRFLYVPNSDGESIQGFSIDQASGALTQIPGLPITTTFLPVATLDPSGRFLYVIHAGTGLNRNSIVSYAIDDTTGALTLVNRLDTGTSPYGIEVVGQ